MVILSGVLWQMESIWMWVWKYKPQWIFFPFLFFSYHDSLPPLCFSSFSFNFHFSLNVFLNTFFLKIGYCQSLRNFRNVCLKQSWDMEGSYSRLAASSLFFPYNSASILWNTVDPFMLSLGRYCANISLMHVKNRYQCETSFVCFTGVWSATRICKAS